MLVFASCTKDNDFVTPETLDQTELNLTSGEDEDHPEVSLMLRSTGLPDADFLNLVNTITGETDDNYEWECCLTSNSHPLGIGNWSDGFRFYFQAPDGSRKPAIFFAVEDDAGELDGHGIRIFFRSGGMKNLPVYDGADPVDVYWNDNFVETININLGSWSGLTEIRLYEMPTTQPMGLDMEFCYALTQFGHNEADDDLLCDSDPVTQFLFGTNTLRTFYLTTSDDTYVVYAGTGPDGDGFYDAVTHEILLPMVPAGDDTEVVRVKLFDGADFIVTVLWTVPTSAVHGPNSIGCPLKLRSKDTLPCDGTTTANCTAAETYLYYAECPLTPAEAGVNIPAIPPILNSIAMGVHGNETANRTYGWRFIQGLGTDGAWVYGLYSGCGKSSEGISNATYTNSGGNNTTARQFIMYQPSGSEQGFGIGTLFEGTSNIRFDLLVGSDGTNHRLLNFTTPNGLTHTDWFNGWTGSTDDILLWNLENRRAILLDSGGNQMAMMDNGNYPKIDQGLFAVLSELGLDAYLGDPIENIKKVDLVAEDCFYRADVGGTCDRYTTPSVPGKEFAFGIDLGLTTYNIYMFDSGDLESAILVKPGALSVTIGVQLSNGNIRWHNVKMNTNLLDGAVFTKC